jgi:hypothetical protein
MPVKLSFADRDSRLNFERSVRQHTGLKATQSLPAVIRRHMAAFRKALEGRHEGQIIMVRHDVASLSFTAFRKSDGDARWTACPETLPIPLGIMLPGFHVPDTIDLPEAAVVGGGDGGGGMMGD